MTAVSPGDECPEGWTKTPLRSVTLPVPNLDPGAAPNRTFGYVDISAIDNQQFRIVADAVKSFLGSEAPSRARRPIQTGDVLFSNVRTYLRNIARVEHGTPAQLCSTGFTVLRPGPAIDSRYLFRWVLTDSFIDAVTPKQTGTHYPATSDRVVLDSVLPVPPLAEQHRIVDKLETLLARVNAVRDHLAKVPAILRQFRQSVLAAACSGRLTEDWRANNQTTLADELRSGSTYVDERTTDTDSIPKLPEVPRTWAIVRIRDVVKQIQYGSNAKADGSAVSGVGMLRMGNVQDGRIDLASLKYVRRSKDLAGFRLQRGDLVFNRTNSPELVGKAAVFNRDDEMVFASYLVRVRTNEDRTISSYLCSWIMSPWGRSWAQAVRTDGVSQSNINASKLSGMPVLLPPLREQHEIMRRVDSLMSLSAALEQRVSHVAESTGALEQSILAKAFRGELVPCEADVARGEGRTYETAEALLQQIVHERPNGDVARKTTAEARQREGAHGRRHQ